MSCTTDSGYLSMTNKHFCDDVYDCFTFDILNVHEYSFYLIFSCQGPYLIASYESGPYPVDHYLRCFTKVFQCSTEFKYYYY